MSRKIYFISHPEVVISRTVPVTQWPLSKRGRTRMVDMLELDWVPGVTAIYCSCEQKAIDGAIILADHKSINYSTVEALGENDRSATGFLESAEFEVTADDFFASPNTSVRGWETAANAQRRIVECVTDISQYDTTEGAIAIVSHGAVGTLLYCYLNQTRIDRRWDQPGTGGGNFLTIDLSSTPSCDWWQPIDQPTLKS